MPKSKKRNRKKKNTSKSGKNLSPLNKHIHRAGKLHSPFSDKLGDKMQFLSWMNDRLPEMLWSTIIITSVNRNYGLSQFRRIISFIGKHGRKDELSDITFSGIAKLDPRLQEELVAFILTEKEISKSLTVLRLFDSLPGSKVWDDLLPNTEPNINLLMSAVGSTLWHQSQEATDCRWLRLMPYVITGKLQVPSHMAKEWYEYPNEGDQRAVRPSIRAAELALQMVSDNDKAWPNNFWKEAWENTPCLALKKKNTIPSIDEKITRQSISTIHNQIEKHWYRTHTTTAINAKHDAIFGMVFYSLRILEDLLGIGIGTSILGRLGIRTLLEIRINLRYLIMMDSEKLWKNWRDYGAGQAKLNELKFDYTLDPPEYIDINSIEQIAGEDMWEEYLSINIASWSGFDLRRLSKKTSLKEQYDTHYSWTSGYAHGMWGSIRESSFQICGNPLHRLHRYPEMRVLKDTVYEAGIIIDETLSDLDIEYPSFPSRFIKSNDKAT